MDQDQHRTAESRQSCEARTPRSLMCGTHLAQHPSRRMEKGDGNEFGINHPPVWVPSLLGQLCNEDGTLKQLGQQLSVPEELKSHRFLPLEGAQLEQMHCKQRHALNNSRREMTKPMARLWTPLRVLRFCPRASNTGWDEGPAQLLVSRTWGARSAP